MWETVRSSAQSFVFPLAISWQSKSLFWKSLELKGIVFVVGWTVYCASPLRLREKKVAVRSWFCNHTNPEAHFGEEQLEGKGGMQNPDKVCLVLPSSAPREGVNLKESLFSCLDVFIVNCKVIKFGIACGKMISHRCGSKAAYCSFSHLLVLTTF